MLTEPMRANFQTLLDAAKAGRLALLEVTRKSDGAAVPLVVAVNPEADGGASFVPLAEMPHKDNPYDLYDPPH